MVLEKFYKEGMSVSFSTQQFCSFWLLPFPLLLLSKSLKLLNHASFFNFWSYHVCTTTPSIRHLQISHNAPYLPAKILPNLCFLFLLGITAIPREFELKIGSSGHKKERGALGRHARKEGAPAREAHENRFNSLSENAEIFYWLRVC